MIPVMMFICLYMNVFDDIVKHNSMLYDIHIKMNLKELT
jgi:hypothetical protein